MKFVSKELKYRPWQKSRWVWTAPEYGNRVVASVYSGAGKDKGLWIGVVSLGFGASQVFISCVDAFLWIEKALAALERFEKEARADDAGVMTKPVQPMMVN